MKIETASGPTILPAGPNAQKAAQNRANAIAKMQTPPSQLVQAQAHPVANPNSISPEEVSALKVGQKNTIESPSSEDESADPAADTASEPAPSQEEPSLSSQYAVLARKERAQRTREQQLRQREAALAAKEEAQRAPKAPEIDSSRYISFDDLAKDPFSYLNKAGVSYEQLTNQALNAPTAEQLAQQQYMKKLESKIEELEKGQETQRKTFEERDAESYKQAVSQIKSEVRSLVLTDPTFETIKSTNAINDVVELIEETFKQDGIVLTAEEAAIEVENHLVEEALKLAKLKKIQQRLAASSSTPKQSQAPQSSAHKQQPMKTLTNAVGTSRQLSAKERAILAFRGELKS